jgi:hypothetical protein
MLLAQPALYLRRAQQFAKSGLQNTPGGCGSDFHDVGCHSLPPTQLVCSGGLILIGLAVAVDLSSSSGVESGSSGRHSQGNVVSTSHRPGLGLELIHSLLSWRARGLHTMKLPECLRRLVTMRSACHFQAQWLLQEREATNNTGVRN